jgi:hypothetical protein
MGQIEMSSSHYVGPTFGGRQSTGPDDSGRVISPAPEWDAETDVGNMTESEPGQWLTMGTYLSNRPLIVTGRAHVTATI